MATTTMTDDPKSSCPLSNQGVLLMQVQLFKACLRGKTKTIRKLLQPFDAEQRLELLDARYDEQLHKSKIGGHKSFERNCTCLHFAAWNGKSQALVLVLDTFSQLTGGPGNTKLVQLINQETTPNRITALHNAAAGGHTTCVRALLLAGCQTDLKEQASGRTPLMWAALFGHRSCVEELVSHGGEANAKDANGQSALDLAKEMRNKKTVQVLVSHGAT